MREEVLIMKKLLGETIWEEEIIKHFDNLINMGWGINISRTGLLENDLFSERLRNNKINYHVYGNKIYFYEWEWEKWNNILSIELQEANESEYEVIWGWLYNGVNGSGKWFTSYMINNNI